MVRLHRRHYKMKRIGLYLGVSPHSGGVFQYSASVFSALKLLDGSDIQLTVVISHSAWIERVNNSKPTGEIIYVHDNWVGAFSRFMIRHGFPISLWRKFSHVLHKPSNQIESAGCDYWIFPAGDILSYSCNVNSISAIHDLMHLHMTEFPEVSKFTISKNRDRHYQSICKYSAAIIVDSNVGKSHVIEAYSPPADIIHVLPYPTPPEIINENFSDEDLLKSVGITNEPFIFYPAQFWTHKNHVRLIEAFRPIVEEFPNITLLLCGSEKNAGKEIRSCIAKYNLSNNIKILGYIEDSVIQALYRKAIALIMPTFFGPTNIPPLEAMRAGCPMAISDIYAMREQSGNAAIYFNPYKISEISACIHRLIIDDDIRKSLSENAKERSKRNTLVEFSSRFKSMLNSLKY